MGTEQSRLGQALIQKHQVLRDPRLARQFRGRAYQGEAQPESSEESSSEEELEASSKPEFWRSPQADPPSPGGNTDDGVQARINLMLDEYAVSTTATRKFSRALEAKRDRKFPWKCVNTDFDEFRSWTPKWLRGVCHRRFRRPHGLRNWLLVHGLEEEVAWQLLHTVGKRVPRGNEDSEEEETTMFHSVSPTKFECSSSSSEDSYETSSSSDELPLEQQEAMEDVRRIARQVLSPSGVAYTPEPSQRAPGQVLSPSGVAYTPRSGSQVQQHRDQHARGQQSTPPANQQVRGDAGAQSPQKIVMDAKQAEQRQAEQRAAFQATLEKSLQRQLLSDASKLKAEEQRRQRAKARAESLAEWQAQESVWRETDQEEADQIAAEEAAEAKEEEEMRKRCAARKLISPESFASR